MKTLLPCELSPQSPSLSFIRQFYVKQELCGLRRMETDGKTGGREIVARRVCQRYLRRIQERTHSIEKLSFEQLLASKIDLPVFALPDGSTTDSLRGTFRQFLKDINILKDPRSGKVRTLYSLRHTYATFALSLAKGTDIHLLARQMGTSVLMIERHYSHLIARMRASDLVGLR